MDIVIAATLIVAAYLLGSITSAVVICRLFNLTDPNTLGSNNPGATNVTRLYGKKLGALTLAGDLLKGFIPVLVAGLVESTSLTIALCSLAVFLGHLFPLFFNFKGGKGVATCIGLLLATHWLLGVSYIITWLLVAWLFRYSSLAALVAVATLPIYSWYLLQDGFFLSVHVIIAVLIFWRHRRNITRLVAGNEEKITKTAN